MRHSRCYKSLDLMFGKANADALPPCAMQLLDTTLQSVAVTPDVFATLMEDALVLSRNCWRIIAQHEALKSEKSEKSEKSVEEKSEKSEKEEATEKEEEALIRELWVPILQMVCRYCDVVQKDNCDKVLDVLRVGTEWRCEA